MHSDHHNDFKRQQYWLGELYDGATSSLAPQHERVALTRAFVIFLDALLRGAGTSWTNTATVHEWTGRALLNFEDALFEMVWEWVTSLIAECGDNGQLQATLSEGLFDDLARDPIDWENSHESRIIDRIMRCLSDPATQWVGFEAYDGNAARLWRNLKRYLKTPFAEGYRGPRTLDEVREIVSRLDDA